MKRKKDDDDDKVMFFLVGIFCNIAAINVSALSFIIDSVHLTYSVYDSNV